ncbi:ABC transporter substrate-binding protein [Jiangella alba]|uniref:ABC transporter substrate-binding protein n=1 Tax=Jiangella alba TaxID=561176 RepID=UPI001495E387|nr:ABC transporter substrate-binding protein [Jiangella alba]
MVASAAVLLVACSGAEATNGGLESDTVVVADYGGTTREARQEAFLTPFADEFGVRTVSADAAPSKLSLFVENERAEWDLIDLDNWDLYRFAEQGLLEPLSDDVAASDMVPEEFQEYASGGYNASTGIGYRTDSGDEPRGWADFFDTDRFPGQRALPSFAYFQAEAALLADGVACEDLYPLDFDRAFDKLDEIRDDVLFYDSFGQAMQYLAQDSVAMTITPNGRISALRDQGSPVAFQWEGGLYSWTTPAVPKFAQHEDAAMALIDQMADPEAQAAFAEMTRYGPMNSEALEHLDDDVVQDLPNSHLDVSCEIDGAGLGADMDEYNQRYLEWAAGE